MNKLKDALREEIAFTQKRLDALKNAEELLSEDELQKPGSPSTTKGGTISERILAILAERGPMSSGSIIESIGPVNPQSVHGTLQALKKDGNVYLKGKAWNLKK